MRQTQSDVTYQFRSRARDFIFSLMGYLQSILSTTLHERAMIDFRCPPRDQMSTILGFKNLEAEDLEEHACSDALRSKMSNFHDQIMKVISIDAIEAEEEDPNANKGDGQDTIWKVVLKALNPQGRAASGEGQAGGESKGPLSQEEKFRKVLVETIIRWGTEAEIESQDLVREMFALLLRQYDTVGELMRATENTYIVDAKTKDDVEQMWTSLSRIRSLLPVQMSRIEEALVRELLW